MSSTSLCEESTFSDIYEQESGKIRNFLFYKCGDLQQAEDLMQDVFTKLWRKCAEVNFEKVIGFLFKSAGNLFLDHVRQNKVSLKFEKTISKDPKTDDPYFKLRTKEFQEQLEGVISALPNDIRETFLLNRIDKLTFKEIASTLDVSQTTVEKRISKALTILKGEISELTKFKI